MSEDLQLRSVGRQSAAGSGRAVTVALLAALVLAALSPASAQSADGGYAGYGGTRWSTDYGIGAGRCDRDAIVIRSGGDARRTLVQRHEENLRNRTVGIIGANEGSGVLLSTTRLGGRLDDRDRHCLGHVLELGTAGREVAWINATTRQSHVAVVTEYAPSGSVPAPAASGPHSQGRCRVLLLTTTAVGVAARGPARRLIACQANPGVWSIR